MDRKNMTISKLFHSGFQRKVFIYYAVFTILLIFGFLILFIRYMYNTNLYTLRDDRSALTQKTAQQIESFLGSMDNMALQFMSDPRLIAVFQDIRKEPSAGNYFKQNLQLEKEIGRILTAFNGPKLSVGRISIYNIDEDYISSGYLYETSSMVESSLKNINVTDLLQQMDIRRIKRLICGSHPDNWSDSNIPVISVYRPLKDLYTGESYAVIEIQQSVDVFAKVISIEGSQTMNAFVYDEDGSLVFPVEADIQPADYYSIIKASEEPDGEVISNGEIITYSILENSGWSLVLAQPTNVIYSNLRPLLTLTILLGISVLLMGLVIVFAVSRHLTKSFTQVKEMLDSVNLSNLTPELRTEQEDDEIAQLNMAFSEMLRRLRQSVENEMSAHILAFQSQMNPHFLYNTLTVISAAGYEGKSSKVSSLCQSLAQMLRYVSSYEQWEVKVSEEIAHTRRYLNLMKERFEDGFYFEIEVDEDAQDLFIPKLAIQPLCENCFNHGFKQVPRPWNMNITVQSDQSGWLIRVEDNGGGFTDDEIINVEQQIQTFSQSPESYKSRKNGGIGLINTIVRLRFLYHEQVHYKIEQNQPHGAIITIQRITEVDT